MRLPWELWGFSFLLWGYSYIMTLIYTAIINGIVDVPMLFIIMRLSNDKKILGEWTNGKVFNIIGWTTVTVNAVAVVLMFVTWSH
jgi:Mn2+/Fe2+ NRAMP family transporter